MSRKAIVVVALMAVMGAGLWAADKVVLNALFMKQAGFSEEDITAGTKDFMDKNPGIQVNLTFVAYEELEQKILTAAAAGGYDVVLSDGPFTAKFAKGGIVKEIPPLAAADKADIFPGALDACEYLGKYWGMPWINDVRYLFYNKKMVASAGFKAPPATLDELIAQAKALKAKKIVEYPIVLPWNQAETLTCDFTTLTALFGGSMAKDGKPTLYTPANVKALQWMVSAINAGLVNPKSITYGEDDINGVFAGGNAAFMFNWTYAYGVANDPSQSKVVGDVAIAMIPGNGKVKSATVNGGQPLSIASGSKHPNEAWAYILYMTGKDFQRAYPTNSLPIWRSLYTDPNVVKSNPDVVAVAKSQYDYIVNRPKVPYYSAFSSMLQVKIQEALLGKKSADQALKEAQAEAETLAK
ncbi:MAG TPA: extracellular solute-binding protein [Rectinemataceae bacterium]|nr:extracellular solute-binding protein [Rectinemataceae bacterium]